jgi:hypothetical protein
MECRLDTPLGELFAISAAVDAPSLRMRGSSSRFATRGVVVIPAILRADGDYLTDH